MKKRRRSVGGGGARNPNSLRNLRVGPPAPVGNSLAVKYGGYAVVTDSERECKVAEVLAALADDAPLRDKDGGLPRADLAALREVAEAMVQLDRCRSYMDGHGFLDRDGRLNGAAEREAQLSRLLWQALADFGLTPAGRAKLGLHVARGLTARHAVIQEVVVNPEVRRAARDLVTAAAEARQDQYHRDAEARQAARSGPEARIT